MPTCYFPLILSGEFYFRKRKEKSKKKKKIKEKIKEKQQVGIKFPNFPDCLPWGVIFLQLNMGKNTVDTMTLKIPGD